MQKAATIRKKISAENILATHKEIVYSSIVAFFLFVVSLVVNFWANNFALSHISNSVNDIVLDNIPTFNVDFIFFQGFAAFTALVTFLIVKKPRRIPFVLKTIAAFILVRSAFIILTHVGPPASQMLFDPGTISKKLTSGGDFFFSSHTGFPFLMALIFWENKKLRNLFLTLSFFFGAAVLLGHLHYSIDVLSAFFITYGIFHVARTFFARDYRTFLQKEKA